MTAYADQVRFQLSQGPLSARQLIENIGISQPTLSRAITSMGGDLVRIGAARSIQYVLRDNRRALPDIDIFRVDTDGKLGRLGLLVPVCPEGFVMQEVGGVAHHSHSLPWWLLDMRPQGFIGRAYAARYAAMLGLPNRLADWNDTHALRALMAHGHDAVGNLLLGQLACERFLNVPAALPIVEQDKVQAYARLAQEAANGEQPGSSAGGEQPKFAALAQTAHGVRHVLVKFSLADINPVTERWRDLLLAEHHALSTLNSGGVPAARSCVIDHGGQRFLELERFDRIGLSGRRGLFSLAALEAEFVGDASAPWPTLTRRLAKDGHIAQECAEGAALLYAFGSLIGNTDMHHGNLSFVSDQGRPYLLAPAYDMLPMGFAPGSGGSLPVHLTPLNLRAEIAAAVWSRALMLADDFLVRINADARFTPGFRDCLTSLAQHIEDARSKLTRLA